MTTQLSLLDGLERRDAAIALVDEHADPDWKDRALEAVYQVALTHTMFASDDVWATGLEKPREPRAMGPVMMRAVRLGYCRTTDRTRPTSNSTQHAQPIRLYASCIYVSGSGTPVASHDEEA